MRLGTELSFAGVRFTPAKALVDGGRVFADNAVVGVVAEGDGGARSFLAGFLAATTGFDDEEEVALRELFCSASIAEGGRTALRVEAVRQVWAKAVSKGGAAEKETLEKPSSESLILRPKRRGDAFSLSFSHLNEPSGPSCLILR